VHLPTLVHDGVPFRRERALEAQGGIERVALLLEHDDLQVVRALDLPRVGRQHAFEHLEEGRLAAAVGPEQPQPHPRRQREVQVAHDRLAPELLAQPARGQEPPRPPAGGGQLDARRGPGLGVARTRLRQLVDLAMRFLDARLGLGRARARLAAQPLDLAVDDVGQRLLVGRFARSTSSLLGKALWFPSTSGGARMAQLARACAVTFSGK
jgi:hypothetical protein